MSVIFNELGGGTSGIDYVSSTPPSSPSSGELWFKPTDNGFTGTSGLWIYKVVQADPLVAYWVSALPDTSFYTLPSMTSSNGVYIGVNSNLHGGLWIDSVEIKALNNSNLSAGTGSAYWTFSYIIYSGSGFVTFKTRINNTALSGNYYYLDTVNAYYASVSQFVFNWTSTGSPIGVIFSSLSFQYRLVHP